MPKLTVKIMRPFQCWDLIALPHAFASITPVSATPMTFHKVPEAAVTALW